MGILKGAKIGRRNMLYMIYCILYAFKQIFWIIYQILETMFLSQISTTDRDFDHNFYYRILSGRQRIIDSFINIICIMSLILHSSY